MMSVLGAQLESCIQH